MQKTSIADFVLRTGLALALGAIVGGAPAYAADKLLEETVDFTGTFIFLEAKIPGGDHRRDPQWRDGGQGLWRDRRR